MTTEYRVEMDDGRVGESDDGSWPALVMACGQDANRIACEMEELYWEPRADADVAEIIRQSDGARIGRIFRF